MKSEAIQIRPGRPAKAEMAARQAHLLDVAGAVFAELGYAAASIDLIAARARVGKQTIYTRYGDKAGLFRAVASDLLHLSPAMADDTGPDDGLEAGLRQRLARLLRAAVAPDYAALFRLFLREATAFPDVFEAFNQVREKQVEQPLTAFIESHRAKGVTLALPVERGVGLLMAMLNSFISLAALCAVPITDAQIEAEADAITHLFLHGALAR